MAQLSTRQLYLDHLAQTSNFPLLLEVDRAEGIYIYDTNGKRYYDLNSGIAVSSIGHTHPKVIEAITTQASKHMHTMVYGEHVQTPQIAYAKLLLSLLDSSLNNIYLLNSGSEVVETAMKLAKRATGRYEIISAARAYHGSSQGSESLRSDYAYSSAFLPLLPGIKHITFNSTTDLEKISCRTAAVIIEPVQAEAGVILPEEGYLQALRDRCDEVGALLILDEIQTGFGRTGQLFAHQKYNVLPDMLCIGKAMGGGMPIGGLIADKELMRLFTKNPTLGHITTFGGHPVTCAAAIATLDVLTDGHIIDQVLEKEAYIRRRLVHPIIREVRSSGLMMAVELTKRKFLKHVVSLAFQKGALVDYFLFNNRSFRLAPPLIYTMNELELAMNLILEAMDEAALKYKK